LLASPYNASDWATALHNVLANPDLAANLRSKGRETVDTMTWEAGAGALYRLLAGVASTYFTPISAEQRSQTESADSDATLGASSTPQAESAGKWTSALVAGVHLPIRK
jgi:hypothetical protein